MVRKASRWARRRSRRPPSPTGCWPSSRAVTRSPNARASRVAARLMRPASAILTWYSEHIVSQNRGGAIITWGPISRKSSRIVSGSSGKFTVAPAWSAIATLRFCSPTQAKGRNETISSVARTGSTCMTLAAVARRLRWLSIAALAPHVVHDDPLESRGGAAHAQHLVGLLLVLDQDDAGLAVLEDGLHVLRGAVDEDPERDGAGR